MAPIILERTVDLRVLRRHFHFRSVQGKDMFKVVEFDGQCLWRCHSGILCQCLYGRGSHQLLAKRERVLNLKRVDTRNLEGPSNNSTHIPTIWWEKGETKTPCGNPWWKNQQKGLTHHYVHPRDVNFGLYYDLQPLPDEELDELVSTKVLIPIWHLQSHLPPFHQKHHKKEFNANSTISKPCHVSYYKNKGEDS